MEERTREPKYKARGSIHPGSGEGECSRTLLQFFQCKVGHGGAGQMALCKVTKPGVTWNKLVIEKYLKATEMSL